MISKRWEEIGRHDPSTRSLVRSTSSASYPTAISSDHFRSEEIRGNSGAPSCGSAPTNGSPLEAHDRGMPQYAVMLPGLCPAQRMQLIPSTLLMSGRHAEIDRSIQRPRRRDLARYTDIRRRVGRASGQASPSTRLREASSTEVPPERSNAIDLSIRGAALLGSIEYWQLSGASDAGSSIRYILTPA